MILDIFAQNAHSQEGKAQVELAQLRYRLPRLRGKGQRRSASRPAASAPAGGPARPSSRSTAAASCAASHKLEAELRDIGRTPRAPSARPGAAAASHSVAIVGYTNAGKSTLLNRLTDAGVLVEDRLFATLDATTRRLAAARRRAGAAHRHGRVRRASCPTSWSRRSSRTLEVVADADLLVHVVDASAPDPEAHIDAVRTGARRDRRRARCPSCWCSTRPTSRAERGRRRLAALHPGSVAVSARTGDGHRRPAAHAVGDRLRALTNVVELLVPFDRGDVLAVGAPRGRGAGRRGRADDGMRVRARLDDAAGRLAEFAAAESPRPVADASGS